MTRLRLLVLLAFLVPMAAAIMPQVTLFATRLEWGGGTGEGPLVVLAALGDETPTLGLSAPQIDLEWDETDAYIGAQGTFLSLFPETGLAHHENAILEVTAARPGWVVYVFPAGPAFAAATCGSVAPAAEQNRTAPIIVDQQRPAPSADTRAAVQVGSDACASPGYFLYGDLSLVLWELDGELTSAQGPGTFQTGHYSDTGARQMFVRATSAVLFFSGTGALYASSLDVTGESVVARTASGSVAGIDVHRQDVVLRGEGMTLHAARSGDALSLRAEGVASMEVAGTSVVLGPDSPDAPYWLWWGALPLAALAAFYLRRRAVNPVRLHRLVREASRHGRAGSILSLAGRLLKRNPSDTVALEARGNTYLNLNDPQRALADAQQGLVTPLARSGPLRASLFIVACRAAFQLGQRDRALAFLGEAWVEDPGVVRAARKHREVAALSSAPAGYA